MIVLAVYGVFLVTKPADITYRPWVHASVFAVPGVGFLGTCYSKPSSAAGRERRVRGRGVHDSTARRGAVVTR